MPITQKRRDKLEGLLDNIKRFLFKRKRKIYIDIIQKKDIRLFASGDQLIMYEGEKDIGFLDYFDLHDKKGYKLLVALNDINNNEFRFIRDEELLTSV
jgi:hypothetical protein